MPAHSDEWRRALKMLADLPEGSTEALLLAHGFTSAVIAGLVDTAPATSTTEPILAGGPSGRGDSHQHHLSRARGAGAPSKAAGAHAERSLPRPADDLAAQPHLTGAC